MVVGLGGAIGSVLRYLTSVLAALWLGEQFPYGTLIVNLVGSFAIGLVHQLASDTLLIPDNLRTMPVYATLVDGTWTHGPYAD